MSPDCGLSSRRSSESQKTSNTSTGTSPCERETGLGARAPGGPARPAGTLRDPQAGSAPLQCRSAHESHWPGPGPARRDRASEFTEHENLFDSRTSSRSVSQEWSQELPQASRSRPAATVADSGTPCVCADPPKLCRPGSAQLSGGPKISALDFSAKIFDCLLE